MNAKNLLGFLSAKAHAFALARRTSTDLATRKYAEGAMMAYITMEGWVRLEASKRRGRKHARR